MNLRNELIEELNKIAENPKSSFDQIIKINSSKLDLLSTDKLSDLYCLHRKSKKLCAMIPFSKDEVSELVQNGEVSMTNNVAELENIFLIAEYIFDSVE